MKYALHLAGKGETMWLALLVAGTIFFITGVASTSSAQGLPPSPQRLPILWYDPVQGPICAGPLGPGPCALVAQWIVAHQGRPPVGTPRPGPFPPTYPSPTGPFPAQPNIDPLLGTIPAHSAAGAIQCAQMTEQANQVNVDTFLTCTRGALVLDRDSMTLVNCVEHANGDESRLAACAGGGIIGSRLTPDQMKAVNCAAQNSTDEDGFAGCIARGLVGDRLSPQQQAVLQCAADNDVDTSEFAGCAGEAILGDRLSPEARAAIDCAVESQGDIQGFSGCAANKFLNLNLNPEQQIAIECVVSSGGQPYVAAGCAASRLTFRELTKCVNGVGTDDGCFGRNNDLVGRNGFLVRSIAGLGGGPGSVIRDPGQVLGGPNSVFNYPRQVLGGPNSVPNQILRNVPSPPPLQVGKIGNHRVCVPWC
jgi:hypothetical protein